MKLHEISVKKPVATSLIFLGIVLIGIMFYTQLPIDMYPDIETNQLTIMTTYRGAGAEDIETNVTRPLEDMLNSTENLKRINSQSKDNISLITLEFNYGTNMNTTMNDVRDKLDFVKQMLPDDASSPMIFKFSTDMIPVSIISATAEVSSNALYKILDEKVANPLNRVPGVGAVTVMGTPKREIQINIIPEKLESYNLTLEAIAGRIAQENINIPAGNFDIGSQTYMLRLEGEIKESKELESIVIGSYRGQNIYLKDIATVDDTIEERAMESYTNGKQAATIIIQKQSGSNTVDIARKVKKALPELQKTLPNDVQLITVMDSSQSIIASIKSLTTTILLALIIVSFVVLFFLGRWRATIIILMTIPISLLGSFIYLYLTGNTINIISLSALSMTIGLVVDDAIVVLENITTHIQRGSRPDQASVYATEEVSLSVIASTLTIVAVFLPMTMIGGFVGIMFRQLGWMVTIIITLSTLVALSLTPMLSSKMLRSEKHLKNFSKFDRFYEKTVKVLLNKLDDFYAKVVNWAARKKWTTTIVISSIVIVLALFSFSKLKTEFMPASDNDFIQMTIELPTGTRTEITRETALSVAQMLKDDFPEIVITSFSVGQASEDNTFAAMSANGPNIVMYRIRLLEASKRDKSIYDIGEEIRQKLNTYPEINRYTVVPGGQQSATSGAGFVEVEIYGYDLKTTDDIASEFKHKFSDIKGLKDVTISRSDYRLEYQIVFDKQKLAMNGLNIQSASAAVRNRINGLIASKYREEGDEYNIKVQYASQYRQSIEDIQNIVLYNSAGNGIRLKELGTVVEQSSLPQIDRKNRERIVKVTGSIYKRALSDVVTDIQKAIDSSEVPSGIGIHIGGSYEEQQDTFRDMTMLLILVTLLVYIVIASQFESLTYPLIIILSAPIAFVGSILLLVITNTPLGIMSFVGLIMLVGMIVKNGIVLIDYINLNRERGMSIITAVVDGGKSRLRPVLMTSLTTILGMLPLAIGTGQGSEMWKPLGVSIMGGMIFATIITLVLIPALYTILGGRGVKKQRRKIKKLYLTK